MKYKEQQQDIDDEIDYTNDVNSENIDFINNVHDTIDAEAEALIKNEGTNCDNRTEQPASSSCNFWWSKYEALVLVFLSGFGFSIQALFIKEINFKIEKTTSAAFFVVFVRGILQYVMSLLLVQQYAHYGGFGKIKPKVIKVGDKEIDPSFWGYFKGSEIFWGHSFKIKLLLLGRAVFGFISIALCFTSVGLMPLGDANTIFMSSPMWAGILAACILGESYGCKEAFSALFSFIGLVLVSRPSFLFPHQDSSTAHTTNNMTDASTENRHLEGAFYAFVGAWNAAGAFVSIRALGSSYQATSAHYSTIIHAQAVGQIICAFPLMLLWPNQLRLHDITSSVLLNTLIATSIGCISQFSMTVGMQRERSAIATIMRMSDVIFSFLWQVIITHEHLNPLSIVGSSIIFFAIAYIVCTKKNTNSENDMKKTFTNNGKSLHFENHDDFDKVDIGLSEEEEEEEFGEL